jgi:hypothetical protein
MPVPAAGIGFAGYRMIEFADTGSRVYVEEAEYIRLLGYPRGFVLDGRARELADWARAWYAEHGSPWMWARETDRLKIESGCVRIEDAAFASERLRQTLHKAEAHSVALVAVSAGSELEGEAQRIWEDQRPDEYYFLETFGSAVVESLVTAAGARLCAAVETQGMAVLPHYSPGYPEWDIAEQPRLLALLTRGQPLPGPLEVLGSGALRPKKSLLAVFGLTHQTESLRRLDELVPCENCSFAPCQFRRKPYMEPGAKYAVNTRALRKWAAERLTLKRSEDGGVDALFRYDGTTCTNMGRPLAFHYSLRLGPREQGFPVRQQRCAPAPGDEGHMYMCEYIGDRERLMAALDAEKPLHGRPLSAVLSWHPASSPAGCYCEPDSREHKWALVLETVHYALTQTEGGNQF